MFLKFAKRNKPYIQSMVIICKEYNTSSPWSFNEVREVTDQQGYFLLKKYVGILEKVDSLVAEPAVISKQAQVRKKKAQSKPKQTKMIGTAKENKQAVNSDNPW